MQELSSLLRPEYIWCILGVIMLFAEFASPGFVMLFFGIGAFLVAILLFLFDIPLNYQILLFLVFSLVSLVLLRKWLKSVFKGLIVAKDKMPENDKTNIGERAIAAEDILPGKVGRIEFNGTLWNALSDEEISEGTPVLIQKQDNITFSVKPIKQDKRGNNAN